MDHSTTVTFETFVSDTERVIGPLLLAHAFVALTPRRDGRWLYYSRFEKQTLGLNVLYNALHEDLCINVTVPNGLMEGYLLEYAVRTLHGIVPDYAPHFPGREPRTTFEAALASYKRMLSEYFIDVLTGRIQLNASLLNRDLRTTKQ